MRDPAVCKIVSGGQTGVDRGALDAAIALGIPHGGWCPKGRKAEDGPIPQQYRLTETPATGYPTRTRWNVRDSDGTLVLCERPPTGGTALTIRLADRLDKPRLIVSPIEPAAAEDVRAWLARHDIKVLNVAGPRESEQPGIAARATALLQSVLASAGPT